MNQDEYNEAWEDGYKRCMEDHKQQWASQGSDARDARDAARYRFLRVIGAMGDYLRILEMSGAWIVGDKFDAAIDAAMGETK